MAEVMKKAFPRYTPMSERLTFINGVCYRLADEIVFKRSGKYTSFEWVLPSALQAHLLARPIRGNLPAVIPAESNEDHYRRLAIRRIREGYRAAVIPQVNWGG